MKVKKGEGERFWAKVVRHPSGCWDWMGACDSHGYGNFGYRGRTIGAHRYSYETLVGVIPDGLEIDHLCRNARCVNPTHMEAVTRSENVRRGLLPSIIRQWQLAKTHCPKGHPYNECNTYISPSGDRSCRTCKLEANRRYRKEHRETTN